MNHGENRFYPFLLLRDLIMSNFKDLTGQKFGKLVVIGMGKDYISPSGYKTYIWKVKCEECKIEYELSKKLFLIKKNQSCNRHNHAYENLIGQKFGKLTVIKKDEEYYIAPKSKKKSVRWICECDCENIHSVIGDKLKSGSTSQCQLCQYKSMQLNGYISYRRFYNITQGAKKRNIYFDIKIDREYLWNLFIKQNKKCALSGIPLHFAENVKKEIYSKGTTASLDRIDSSKGYIKSNIQWVHKDINRMKSICSNSEFIKICKDIVRWNKS